MNDIQMQEARTRIASLCERLRGIEDALHDRSVEELGTGRPLNSNVSEAIKAIESVREDLLAIGSEQLATPLDKSVEQESMQRAISEVASGEYDMQG